MIGCLLNALVGLWLAYSAIFAAPAGNMSNTRLAIAGAAVIALAAWVRQNEAGNWQSATNLALGSALILEAAARWAIEVPPLVSFWMTLLLGIAVAILALWSVLYRPDTPAAPAAP